jgi:hypothetical protein
MRKPVPRKPNKVETPKTVYNRKKVEKCDHIEFCPKCHARLFHFSGLESIPEYLYCAICEDVAYDYDGSVLFKLV